MKLLPLIILALLVIPLVIAPPKQTFSGATGFDISFPEFEVIRHGTNFNLTLNIYNSSNGMPIFNAGCRLTAHNITGEVVFDTSVNNTIKNRYVVYLQTQFADKGFYSFDIGCNNTNIGGFVSGVFEINESGYELSTANAITYFIGVLGMFGLFLLLLYGAIKIPYHNKPNSEGQIIGVHEYGYIKVFCIVFSYVILMWTLGILGFILREFEIGNGINTMFNWGFWVMFSFMWPLIVVSFLLILVNYLNRKKFIKALERGVPLR